MMYHPWEFAWFCKISFQNEILWLFHWISLACCVEKNENKNSNFSIFYVEKSVHLSAYSDISLLLYQANQGFLDSLKENPFITKIKIRFQIELRILCVLLLIIARSLGSFPKSFLTCTAPKLKSIFTAFSLPIYSNDI